MSNDCSHCCFDPKAATDPRASLFTTLFWDCLTRNQGRFANHPRTALMWRNLARLAAIRAGAQRLRGGLR